MPRLPLKALFAALAITRSSKMRPNWDRAILIFAVVLTLGLLTFYVLTKIGAF
jgi:hypothetical protein